MFAHFLCSIYREAYLPLHTPFKVCNNTSITPLPSSNVTLTTADGSVLQPCGNINVPITINDNKNFTFQMPVIPNLPVHIVFGNNHLARTDAEIHCSENAIYFGDKSMDFEVKCRLMNSLNGLLARVQFSGRPLRSNVVFDRIRIQIKSQFETSVVSFHANISIDKQRGFGGGSPQLSRKQTTSHITRIIVTKKL